VAINYADQHSLVSDSSLRLRVEAGCSHVALNVTSPTVSGHTPSEIALANEVIKRTDFAVTPFCWAIVDKQQLVDIDDVTDTQITSIITQFWGQVAGAFTPI
jgi:hypothetical protein